MSSSFYLSIDIEVAFLGNVRETYSATRGILLRS